MYEIPNFSNYFLNESDEIVRKSDNKIMPVYLSASGDNFLKLKEDTGKWLRRAKSTIIALAKPPKIPENFYQVPGYKSLFISREGVCWSSPNKNYPTGHYLTVHYPKTDKHYPSVSPAESGRVEIHRLLALTYLDCDYVSKGLCVMHLDDDKSNFSLSNLKIGTYSENNKAAYDTGANPGRTI